MDEPEHFEELPPEEQGRLRTTVRQMTELAYGRVIPVLIASPLCVPQGIMSASGFLVATWGGTWLGTAWHVLEGYRALLQQDHRTRLEAGGTPVYPNDGRRTWTDERADIALIELTSDECSAIPSRPHAPPSWPPLAVTTDSYILVSGFPAHWRETLDPRTAGFNALSMRLRVTTVGETHLTCQLRREQMIDVGPSPLPGPGIELGGISGAPVLAESKLHYPLVGLVKLWGASTDIMVVATLSHLPEQL